MTPLNAQEWLEGVIRAAGPDVDWARETLAALDAAESAEAELVEWYEKTDGKDPARVESLLDSLTEIEDWAENSELVSAFPGDSTLEQLQELAKMAERYEARSHALSEMLMAAGILKTNDYATDPLPLLRMFLPE